MLDSAGSPLVFCRIVPKLLCQAHKTFYGFIPASLLSLNSCHTPCLHGHALNKLIGLYFQTQNVLFHVSMTLFMWSPLTQSALPPFNHFLSLQACILSSQADVLSVGTMHSIFAFIIHIDFFSLCVLSLPLDYNLPNGKDCPLIISSTLCLAHKCLLIWIE